MNKLLQLVDSFDSALRRLTCRIVGHTKVWVDRSGNPIPDQSAYSWNQPCNCGVCGKVLTL